MNGNYKKLQIKKDHCIIPFNCKYEYSLSNILVSMWIFSFVHGDPFVNAKDSVRDCFNMYLYKIGICCMTLHRKYRTFSETKK